MADFPEVREGDPDAVTTALEVGASFWSRGDNAEAMKWLRKAVDEAFEAGVDDRGLELSKFAATLASLVPPPPPEAPAVTSTAPATASSAPAAEERPRSPAPPPIPPEASRPPPVPPEAERSVPPVAVLEPEVTPHEEPAPNPLPLPRTRTPSVRHPVAGGVRGATRGRRTPEPPPPKPSSPRVPAVGAQPPPKPSSPKVPALSGPPSKPSSPKVPALPPEPSKKPSSPRNPSLTEPAAEPSPRAMAMLSNEKTIAAFPATPGDRPTLDPGQGFDQKFLTPLTMPSATRASTPSRPQPSADAPRPATAPPPEGATRPALPDASGSLRPDADDERPVSEEHLLAPARHPSLDAWNAVQALRVAVSREGARVVVRPYEGDGLRDGEVEALLVGLSGGAELGHLLRALDK